MKNIIYLIFFVFIFNFQYLYGLNIVLHAQVAPVDKIVGSVITTEGLKQAFLRRRENINVIVIYPFEYDKFLIREWDLIIIEGWFTTINDFISLARVKSPQTKIIYYCLDPIFPNINITINLDVDGYFTNSKSFTSFLSNYAPTLYLPLAADIQTLKPSSSIQRDWDCIYIGAGGHMLETKPLLLKMLNSCSSSSSPSSSSSSFSYKLRLHGSHWNNIQSYPNIQSSWQGHLPKDMISDAYNSAKVVLASTILSQANEGMINNRIFEAMSCGSLIISDDFQALREMFGKFILFVHNEEEIQNYLELIIYGNTSQQLLFDNIRQNSRKEILKFHTWDHRIIKIIDFFIKLKGNSQYNYYQQLQSSFITIRKNIPILALIVNETIKLHPDYIYSIYPSIFNHFSTNFIIQEFNYFTWKSYVSSNFLNNFINDLTMIIAIFTPYDLIHQFFFNEDYNPSQSRFIKKKNTLQKMICYIIGSPPIIDIILKISPIWYTTLTDVFDIVLFRDEYEKNIILEMENSIIQYYCQNLVLNDPKICSINFRYQYEKRWQHTFGINYLTSNTTNLSLNDQNLLQLKESYDLAFCFIEYLSLCTQKIRNSIIKNNNYTLILYGGNFEDWIQYCETEFDIDCILRNTDNSTILTSILSRTIHISSKKNINNYNSYPYSNEFQQFQDLELPILQQDDITQIICSSKKVFYFYSLEEKKNTINDIIWPIVTATICNKPIHFLHHPGNHIQTIILQGCNNWDQVYLNNVWITTLEKIHGLATSRSKVSIISNYNNGQTIPYNQILQQPIILQPITRHFVSGRDGKICLHHQNRSIICLIRDSLQISPHFPLIKTLPCIYTFNISFVLQSHIYADIIYQSEPFVLHICSPLTSNNHNKCFNNNNSNNNNQQMNILEKMENVYTEINNTQCIEIEANDF